MLRVFIIINYLIGYIINILKNNTNFMGLSSSAMLIHKLEAKTMGAKGKCTQIGRLLLLLRSASSAWRRAVRTARQLRSTGHTVGVGAPAPLPNNDPNKKKNSFYEYFKKLFKFIFNIFNILKASIINKYDILIGLILLPLLVSLAYMTLNLHNYLDVNMANYLMFKETLA
jgi:hypothetical protein